MHYTITRDGQQYGPYTLADLQRYVASGDILLSDLAFGEEATEPVSISQIVGTIAVRQPVASSPMIPALLFPNPPNLPWVLLLVLSFFCGIFVLIWNVVLGVWLRKVSPRSKVLSCYLAAIGCWVFIIVLAIVSDRLSKHTSDLLGDIALLFLIASAVLWIAAGFIFGSEMEQHYSNDEGIALSLNRVMVFFFGAFYFQYHVNRIVEQKQWIRQSGR